MTPESLKFPDDAALALAIARRFVTWLADEKARTGLSDEAVAEKYGFTFDETDRKANEFLGRLEADGSEDIG